MSELLTPGEIKQEIINTLAMVENELCFGGNWEDAKARINRCRLVLAKVRDRPDREKFKQDFGYELMHKYGVKSGSLCEEIAYCAFDQLSALFEGIGKDEIEKAELMTKAMAVIEGSLIIDEPKDKRLSFIYRMAHVGRGECIHPKWIEEMDNCYQELVKGKIISPIALKEGK